MLKISYKKLGIILILAGVFLHIISIPYLSYYNPAKGYLGSIRQMKVILIPGTFDLAGAIRDGEITATYYPEIIPDRYYPGRVYIEYRTIFGMTSLLIFIGLIIIVITGRKQL